MYIRNKGGPRTEPCGTPDFIISQEEIWPLRMTLTFDCAREDSFEDLKVLLLHRTFLT